MGEIRALNTQDDAVWQAGIRNPDNEETVLLKVPLHNRALATSGGYGTVMDEAGASPICLTRKTAAVARATRSA